MKFLRKIFFLLIALGASLQGTYAQSKTDLEDSRVHIDFLIKDVGVIEVKGGVPGPVAIFGPRAFPVILANKGSDKVAVVAGSQYGKGRVVVLGHDGYLGPDGFSNKSTLTLIKNSARWVGAATSKEPRISVWHINLLGDVLRRQGLSARYVNSPRFLEASRDADVVIFQGSLHSLIRDAEAIQSFVRRGGGLIIAGLGWGWLYLNPGLTLRDHHPGNIILASMGLAFSNGYVEASKASEIQSVRSEYLNASYGLSKLMQIYKDGLEAKQEELEIMVASIETTAEVIFSDYVDVQSPYNYFSSQLESIRPISASNPLGPEQTRTRQIYRLQHALSKMQSPTQINESPSARFFPGKVPDTATPVDSRKVLIPPRSAGGWLSTGLYAKAGVPIFLTSENAPVGWTVQIGSHSDENWHHRQWTRHPSIIRKMNLSSKRSVISSPFGGLIYLEGSEKALKDGIVVEIEGAYAAPRYVLGKTTLAEWEKLRHSPAPWAEFESSKIILTLESRHVRQISDPEPVLEFWDSVLDLYSELSTRKAPARPWRIVNDQQISVGYMHSGYPIKTHLDVGDLMINVKELSRESRGWGFWHELGHNHQDPDWTFDGTGEVTCNLFSLYVVERLSNRSIWETVRSFGGITAARRYLSSDAPFADWKRNPFLALVTYVQLVDAFGWDAVKRVFAAYRDAPASEKPKSDDEKRDRWLQRMSQVSGRNLGPFFDLWRIPVSASAKASVAHLPPWMPPALPN